MSNKFKVGDYVRYVRHACDNDIKYFTIGKTYTVERIRDDGALFLKDLGLQVFISQVVPAIHDNKLNRVLYPELKPKEGYLVREEN